MTLFFNYTFLVLRALNYGGFEEAKHYMRSSREEEKDKVRGVFE